MDFSWFFDNPENMSMVFVGMMVTGAAATGFTGIFQGVLHSKVKRAADRAEKEWLAAKEDLESMPGKNLDADRKAIRAVGRTGVWKCAKCNYSNSPLVGGQCARCNCWREESEARDRITAFTKTAEQVMKSLEPVEPTVDEKLAATLASAQASILESYALVNPLRLEIWKEFNPTPAVEEAEEPEPEPEVIDWQARWEAATKTIDSLKSQVSYLEDENYKLEEDFNKVVDDVPKSRQDAMRHMHDELKAARDDVRALECRLKIAEDERQSLAVDVDKIGHAYNLIFDKYMTMCEDAGIQEKLIVDGMRV